MIIIVPCLHILRIAIINYFFVKFSRKGIPYIHWTTGAWHKVYSLVLFWSVLRPIGWSTSSRLIPLSKERTCCQICT